MGGARYGFEQVGRGMVVVDTNVQEATEEIDGNPSPHVDFAYFGAAKVEKLEDAELIRKVRQYDPDKEFVAVLVWPDRWTSYRVGVPPEKQQTP